MYERRPGDRRWSSLSSGGSAQRSSRRRASLVFSAALLIVVAALAAWSSACGDSPAVATEAPEAKTVLAVQKKMPFQIMIPAFLPKDFDRAGMKLKIDQAGPGGEPMVELVYSTEEGKTVTVQEWVPVNPDLESLAASRPIETKWGRGWFLKQGEDLVAVWTDVGPTRVSVFTTSLDVLPAGKVLAVAETLGPASNKQVFSFDAKPRRIKEMAPPEPFKVPVKKGVQKLTLVVTPGGYSPLRFSVKQGVPVKLTFRQLGQVGCGNELIFPADPVNPSSLRLATPSDQAVLEYTPEVLGTFEFHCSHLMYKGLVTVRE